MKKSIALGVVGAFMSHGWQPPMIATIPMETNGYSYPLTNNRRTGKAAERRKAKQRRRVRA
ncbi:hypothetical protein EC843_101988 [Buttiauxella sp. JUb87]|uniref:hypothetical protein n=1 Tax=Buttiauxella sp. JUb87 TaxID=2485129 RepID=UPI00105CB4F2|nr:hypothetical protein [Buttiauxella sp. JUb87]TDN54929.1 hypothetical protein EC843_101988 [Buttiauxella sp. JUb87]